MGEKWPKESGSNDRLTANAEYNKPQHLEIFPFHPARACGREKVCAHLSMGGMLPAAAARLSVGSRCEKLRNVAYQSAIWTIPLLTVPRTAGGRNPPLTKAATLMPPSKRLYLRVAQWIVQTLAAFIPVVSTGVRTSRPSSASCWRRSRRGRPARRCYTAAAL